MAAATSGFVFLTRHFGRSAQLPVLGPRLVSRLAHMESGLIPNLKLRSTPPLRTICSGVEKRIDIFEERYPYSRRTSIWEPISPIIHCFLLLKI